MAGYFMVCDNTCFHFWIPKKNKKIQKHVSKKYIYSKENKKIIEARKGCRNAKKKPKLVEEVQNYKRLKFDSIFLVGENPVDKKNSI